MSESKLAAGIDSVGACPEECQGKWEAMFLTWVFVCVSCCMWAVRLLGSLLKCELFHNRDYLEYTWYLVSIIFSLSFIVQKMCHKCCEIFAWYLPCLAALDSAGLFQMRWAEGTTRQSNGGLKHTGKHGSSHWMQLLPTFSWLRPCKNDGPRVAIFSVFQEKSEFWIVI